MRRIFLSLLLTQLVLLSYGQFVARAEIKEKIEGICDINNVYSLFPMLKGQQEAVCSVADSTIERRLNEEIAFLKDNPKYSDKGMVSIIINCKGEVVQCKIDNKSKSPELDEQVLKVFQSLTSFTAGKLDGKEVDSLRLWSYEIKKGKLKL